MSAAPQQKPEIGAPAASDPASHDAEGWALLEGLRRRLDDQTSQGRKTQQQVSQLAESIAALVEVQRRRTRNLNLNSFVAYLIFTMLCGAGFYLLYSTRAGDLVATRQRAQDERDLAVKRADELTTKATARERADASAWEVYQLLEAGKREAASSKLAAAESLALSRTERAVLAARAHETRVVEVDAAIKAAAMSFKGGRHAEVIAPLEAALVGEPAGLRAATIRFYLGVAYAKTNVLDKAVGNLTAAAAVEAEFPEVRFHLASALDRRGEYVRARAEYDRYATGHPQSSFAAFAMRRSATLARMPKQVPATGAGTANKPVAPKPAVPKAAPVTDELAPTTGSASPAP